MMKSTHFTACTAVFTVAACLCTARVDADEARWVTTGKTQQVMFQRAEFGDIHVEVHTEVTIKDVSTLPYVIESTCDLSQDPICDGLYETLYSAAQCTWSALDPATQDALDIILGACTKICNQTTFTKPGGENVKQDSWSCDPIDDGQCLTLVGLLDPGLRVDMVGKSTECNP